MTHSRQWNDETPLVSDVVKYMPQNQRVVKEDFEERFGVDHIIGESVNDGAGQDGVHKQLTLSRTEDQALLVSRPGSMVVFVDNRENNIDIDRDEFFVLNENGNSIKITDKDCLNNMRKAFVSSQKDTDKIIFFGKSSNSGNLSFSYPSISNKEIIFSSILDDTGMTDVEIPEDGIYLIQIWIKPVSAPTFYTRYEYYNSWKVRRIYQHGFYFAPYNWEGHASSPSGTIRGSICVNNLSTFLLRKYISMGSYSGPVSHYLSNTFPWTVASSGDAANPNYRRISLHKQLFSQKFTWSGILSHGDQIRFMFDFNLLDGVSPLNLSAATINQDHYIIIYKVG